MRLWCNYTIFNLPFPPSKLYTKSYRKPKNPENGRKCLPQERAHLLVIILNCTFLDDAHLLLVPSAALAPLSASSHTSVLSSSFLFCNLVWSILTSILDIHKASSCNFAIGVFILTNSLQLILIIHDINNLNRTFDHWAFRHCPIVFLYMHYFKFS